MSKATEFLAYLGDEPQTRDQLCTASGEEKQIVSNRLQALQGMGFAKRTAGGWVITPKGWKAQGGEAMPEVAAGPIATEAIAPADDGEPTLSFFLDEDLDLQITARDGSGTPMLVPRVDVLRLMGFLERFGDALRSA